MILVLPGSNALSPFRIQKLESDIGAAGLEASIRDTRFIHLVDISGMLMSDEERLLNAIDGDIIIYIVLSETTLMK